MYVPVGFVLSVPDAVTVPELALPELDVAFVLPFIAIVCPEHKLKSVPALTVGAAFTTPLTATFTEVALVLLHTTFAAVGLEANAFIRT